MQRIKLWLREHKPFAPFTNKRHSFKDTIIKRRSYTQDSNNRPKESVIPVVIYPDAFVNKGLLS